MRRVAWIAAAVFLVLAAVGGGFAWWLFDRYERPGPLVQTAVVIVPKGAGVNEIAAHLAERGVIANAVVFRLGARLEGADTGLRAGEYAFPAGASARDVVDRMERGDTVVRRLTVPEGLTTTQVIALVTMTPGLEGDIGLPPAEGTLLPETYHYSWGDARADVLRRMAASMRETIAELWPARATNLPFNDPSAAVVLASIIEKETAVAEERSLVAGVFLNRLNKGMRLQSDPTVVYGLAGGRGSLGRPLTRADLADQSPYNTYVIDGLPPAPIANPGRAALAAAMNSAKTDALYFVADGSGGHVFAKTLDEHNRNVAKWRKIQRSE